MSTLVSIDEFRIRAREDHGYVATVQRLATGPAVEVEGQSRTLRFCFSDGTVDRAGDSIDPKGWELDNFLKNPVALWAHDSWSPPVGRASNVSIVGKRLMGDIEFAPAETYAFADTIYRLSKEGYINAVSVGFNPLEYTFVNDKDRPFGIDFKRQELLEISPCPVPCNANALAEARAKGIDIVPIREWAEKILDGENAVMVPRSMLEEIFKATNTPHAARAKYRDLIERAPASIEEDVPVIEKAGRRISKDNMDRLNAACDHIKAVMSSNEGDDAEPDADDVPTDGAPVADDHVVMEEPPAVVKTPIEIARDAARATLAAAGRSLPN